MRFRSMSFLLIAGLFLYVSTASAQKRVFATVNPNAAFLNNDADIFDPATGKITPLSNPLNLARQQHVAVRMASGKVLIAGGYNNHYLKEAEIFDPATGTITVTDEMVAPRRGATGVLTSNGEVFLLGGYNGGYLRTVDVYDPAKATFSILPVQMTLARQNPGAVLLNDGTILIAGGFMESAFIRNAERYDPQDRVFKSTTGLMNDAREGHSITVLPNGKVLIAGGCNNSVSSEIVCSNYLASAEIFDPSTNLFTYTGSMAGARRGHTAVLLSNGKVLIAGGTDATNALSTAEIYDPATGTFSSTGSMGSARMHHTASILPDGKVLIAGGQSDTPLSGLEVYNPTTGQFVPADVPMSSNRSEHSATVLSDGKILLAAGRNHNLLVFDINVQRLDDNIAPNIYFTPDSQAGFVPYTGSGTIAVFSPQTGAIIKLIETKGKPFNITPILNGQKLAVVSALDNRIFIINPNINPDPNTSQVEKTYTFTGSSFGFGSIPTISPDGKTGYISSTLTGAVIKFDVATGDELGRLSNLSSPAQITITKNGATLLIVDTIANMVVIADATSMTQKGSFQPLSEYPVASFSIFNKVLLNSDESIAMIPTSTNLVDQTTYSGALLFDPSSGAWILDDEDDDDNDGSTTDIDEDEGDKGFYAIGNQPGYSTLLPDGSRWLVLTNSYLSLVPTIDPRNDETDEIDDGIKDENSYVKNFANAGGSPLLSSNVVLSGDAKYAYYATATYDRIYQQDLATGAVVGSFLVGDNPDDSEDQASNLAFTPDYKVLAVVNFSSNGLDLLSDSIIFRQTKYVSQQDQFTGLSLINLSDSPAEVSITAMTDSGSTYDTDVDITSTYDDITNPATVVLAPHAQTSIDVSELFGLKNENANIGYLVIESLQPFLAAHTAIGQIKSSYLGSYISNLQGNPLYRGYGNYPTDFILPEIPTLSGTSTEIVLLNPNYTTATYDNIHYSTNGTEIQTTKNKAVSASSRDTQKLADIVTSTYKGQVLVTGGVAENKTTNSSEIFFAPNTFDSSVGSSVLGRYGHAAALMPNGKVLITGGRNGFSVLKNAEIYDPASKLYTSASGSMQIQRYRHTATRLANGLILLAGGQNSDAINRTAELYNSVTGSFSYTAGVMTLPRDAHTATVLNNGKVLLVGGLDGVGITATAEIFDPATGTFAPTTSMSAARAFHTATMLQNGTVLIAGGYNGSYLNSAEIYNPQTGSFTTVAAMVNARSNHAATMLSNGTVLLTGGVDADTISTGGLDTAEIFDPNTLLFAKTRNNMFAHRSMHTAINLLENADGTSNGIVIIGGFGYNTVVCNETSTNYTATDCDGDDIEDVEEEEVATLATADVYDPDLGLFSKSTAIMSKARQEFTALLLEEGVQAGYMRFQSDLGLMSTEFYNSVQGGATTSINGINVDQHVGVKSIFSPRFVITSSGRNTKLNIINANEDNDASVTVNLRASSNGSILATKVQTLNKNAQIKADLWDIFPEVSSLLDPETKTLQGWVEVISSADKIVGMISFTNSSNAYLASFELSGSPMSRFIYPLISDDSEYETEISLLSPETSAQVEIELWNANGQEDGVPAVINMPAQSSFSKTLRQIFPNMSDHRYGYVIVKSSAPIHATGEMRYKNLRFISSVPPVVLPE